MALMDDLRTKLTAIGNAIRSKTGGSDPLTLDGMVDAINGISTGGGGGGGGGGTAGPVLDNGFTINFYNHDKELIEVHSAKCGMFIDKPLSYEAESWQNENGYINSFPLTVNSAGAVVDLYAGGAATCAQMLYSYYGIDAGEYPFLFILAHTNDNLARIYFAKTARHYWSSSVYYMEMTTVLRSTVTVHELDGGTYNYRGQENVLKWTNYVIGKIAPDQFESLETLTIPHVGSGYTYNPGCDLWYKTLPNDFQWGASSIYRFDLNVTYEA